MKRLTFFIFLCSTTIFCQESSSNKEAYVWFDSIVGHENLMICSGEKHSENYKTVKGHYPFLLSNNYYTSEVSYDHQVYYNVQIKYNVLDDELIAFIPTAIDKYPIILSKDKVAYFFIQEHLFVNLKNKGYAMVLSQDKTGALYKKYTKRKLKEMTNNSLAYKFQEKSSYLLFHNNAYNFISSKRDWIDHFPEKKSQIRSYYSSNRKLQKSAPDTFMTNLYHSLIK